ncbi:recombinase family protein [Laribacter hongkongensis]|uniref:recombinase family protein n=1 Tax=Laribacter hongkongensis TaxID=168471 RepID=UPI0005A05DBF|nr:recombinase family protein [Laribacter hongkongensis]
MAIIGYARVSTHEQNLDLQIDALNRAGCDLIYTEQASGKSAKKSDRPELDHCLRALRPGDTLAVCRLDRLGRSLHDLISIVHQLESRGVGFRSLTEAMDATGPMGKLILHIFAALAEFERALIRERTLAGLAAARSRGRHGGRPRALSDSDARAAVALLAQPGIPVSDICRRFGVSRSTLYGYANALKQASPQAN